MKRSLFKKKSYQEIIAQKQAKQARALESIGDALEGLVWVNDKQIMSWDGSRLFHDLNNPRTEITVRWDEKNKG